MSSTPYMRLYIGDYLGDTSHLTTLQHGAYLLLIMAYWQKGGYVRNTDVILRTITRTTPEEWEQCKETVLEFFEERDGFLYHKRIDKELQKTAEISSKCKDAIAKRWAKHDTDVLPTYNGRNTTPIFHTNININTNIKKDNIVPVDTDVLPTYNGRNTDVLPTYPDGTPAPKDHARFVKPTLDEVRAYCLKRKNSIDPTTFIDHYESNGWMVGRTHMKKWQAAVRTWERNSNQQPHEPTIQEMIVIAEKRLEEENERDRMR